MSLELRRPTRIITMRDCVRSDVLIVGAGLIGASIAWLLAKEGCSVVLVDAGQFGGEASSAGAGMLAPGGEFTVLSSIARLAIESLEMYPGFIHELEKDSGFKIDFQKSGAIELAYDQAQWVKLHERFCAQLAFGTAVASIVPSSVRCFAPGVDTTDLRGALLYPHDACVSPTDLLQALRIACCRYGVNILENSPVTGINAGKHNVSASTAGRRFNARNVVLAAGAWSSQIPIYQHDSVIPVPKSSPVKGHIAGYQFAPNSLRLIVRHGHFYVVQRSNGFTLAGSSEERCGFDRSLNPKIISEIRSAAGRFYPPILAAEPDRIWVGFRPACDELGPVIRRVNGTGIWLAYGHYRNGILLTPVTAYAVSREILAAARRS